MFGGQEACRSVVLLAKRGTMHARHLDWSVVVVTCALLLMGAAGCKKPEADEGAKKKGPPTCPELFEAKEHTDGLTCICDTGKDKGKVWGNSVYMTGSATCTAAIHAGAITKTKGGKVEIRYASGCKSYKGSTKNGISSGFWSGNDHSFYFAGHGDGKCDE
jgi:hypothetical protein